MTDVGAMTVDSTAVDTITVDGSDVLYSTIDGSLYWPRFLTEVTIGSVTLFGVTFYGYSSSRSGTVGGIAGSSFGSLSDSTYRGVTIEQLNWNVEDDEFAISFDGSRSSSFLDWVRILDVNGNIVNFAVADAGISEGSGMTLFRWSGADVPSGDLPQSGTADVVIHFV